MSKKSLLTENEDAAVIEGNAALSPRFLMLNTAQKSKRLSSQTSKADFSLGRLPGTLSEAAQQLATLIYRAPALLGEHIDGHYVAIQRKSNGQQLLIEKRAAEGIERVVIDLIDSSPDDNGVSTLVIRDGAFSSAAAKMQIFGAWRGVERVMVKEESFESSELSKEEIIEDLFLYGSLLRAAEWQKLEANEHQHILFEEKLLESEKGEEGISRDIEVLKSLEEKLVQDLDTSTEWQVLSCEKDKKSYLLRHRASRQTIAVEYSADECTISSSGIVLLRATRSMNSFTLASGYPSGPCGRLALEVSRLLN